MAFNEGLKKWASKRKTAIIAQDLEDKENVDDPEALAVWLRRKALGESEFRKHQQGKK